MSKKTDAPLKNATDEELKAELKIARKFSPIGKLPKDFAQWFTIKKTRLGGKSMNGVFATVDIPKNMILGEYRGKVTYGPHDMGFQNREPFEGDYVVKISETQEANPKRTKFVDGQDPAVSSWLRLINTARPRSKNNAVFFGHKTGSEWRLYVKSTQMIPKGKQVYIFYKLRAPDK